MELHFPLILDGATGTELQKRGYTGDVSAEQWVLAHPDSILSIQRDYVAAGSQVLYTPTFGGNAVKLAEHGVTEDTAAYNRRLADLSGRGRQGPAGRRPVSHRPVSGPSGQHLLRPAGGRLRPTGSRTGSRRCGPVRH